MHHFPSPSFQLDQFEGPLDLLLHLVQNSEVDIASLTLSKVTAQYLEIIAAEKKRGVPPSAQFLSTAASLILLKSRYLLPVDEENVPIEEEGLQSGMETLENIFDYCLFRERAEDLISRLDKQSLKYGPGRESIKEPKQPAIQALISLEALETLFHEVLERSQGNTGCIEQEKIQVGDAMEQIQQALSSNEPLAAPLLFPKGCSRLMTIVIFLALLELLKTGEAHLLASEDGMLLITSRKAHES